jgi:methionine synthase II (cobalamin-independent)
MQVTLPSAVISVLQILAPWQDLAPAAERAIKHEIDGILAAVPHEDLAIQFDVAAEIVINECRDRADEADSELMEAKIAYPDTWEDAAASVAREADMVPADVELGFHFCYGNPTGKHVIEPQDMGKMTRLYNMIVAQADRPINYLHMPVPISRDDEAYYAPLADLDRRDTQLYLGLVHPSEGVEGAARRMTAARATVEDFGIATECGMSPHPADNFEEILELHREIAAL